MNKESRMKKRIRDKSRSDVWHMVLGVVFTVVMCFLLCPVQAKARNVAKVKVTEQEADKNPIPDKYNTGCKGRLTKALGTEWIKVSGNDKVSQFQLKEGKTDFVFNFWDCNKEVEGKLYIDDYDFSDKKVSVRLLVTDDQKEEAIPKDITLVFRNCKFGLINRLPYVSKLKMEFENCSICTYQGSNAKFSRCAFGGSHDDGLQAQIDVTASDCYFSDFNKPNKDGTHTDGIHLFGDSNCPVDIKNITIQNCRFEIPQIELEENTGYVNSCVSLAMEYGDADHLRFSGNIMNGGGYTIYAGVKKDYDNGKNGSFKVSDILFENNRIGDAKTQWGAVYPLISKGVTITDLARTDALYVGSVWKDETGIHMSVTNDTMDERTLKIVTDKGVFVKTIPACPSGKGIAMVKSFEQLPIDLVVTVPKSSSYVVCLDVTDPLMVSQIRFVNYSGGDVYINEKHFGGKQKRKNTILLTGKCGENVTYTLTKDYVLTLTGSGDMYDYSPQAEQNPKPTPWMKYLGNIRKVVISEGISSVGDFAFSGCYSLAEVTIPDSVRKINQYAFGFCASLREVVLPQGVTLGQSVFEGTQIR